MQILKSFQRRAIGEVLNLGLKKVVHKRFIARQTDEAAYKLRNFPIRVKSPYVAGKRMSVAIDYQEVATCVGQFQTKSLGRIECVVSV